MKNYLQTLLLFVTLVVSAMATATEVGTVIHIDVDASGRISVEGKPTPGASVTSSVAALVHERARTAVEIKIQDKTEKSVVEQVKEACRKAGLSLFTIVPGPKG